MVDFVDFDVEGFDYVVVDEFEVFVAEPVFDVAFAAGEEVVGYYYFVAAEQWRGTVTREKKCQKIKFLAKFFLKLTAPKKFLNLSTK